MWSRVPAWGYLDHPPMVAAWIRAGCAVAGDTALGVRLLGPVSALLGTLLLARAAEDLAPGRRAGLITACLFNATLICNAGAVLMTPDTPLLFFWTLALAGLARLVRGGSAHWWLLVGAASGLALDSKYTAGLLGVGIVAWLAVWPSARRWWLTWQLWAGGAMALALFAPVLAWNAAHGYASFVKQGGRAGDWHPARAAGFIGELLAGQFSLATPLVAAILAAGLARAARDAWRRDQIAALLACLTLPPAALFLQHALGDRVQANWPAVIYPGAVLAAVCLGAAPVRLWRVGTATGIVVSAVVLLQAAAAPLTLPRAWDPTLIRLAGWQDLAGAVYTAELGAKASFVAADDYGLASELAFRMHGPVVGLAPRWALFDALSPADLGGRTGLLVRSARESGPPDARPWQQITQIAMFTRSRGGVVAETYRLYQVVGRSPAAESRKMVVLPAVRLRSPRLKAD